MPKFRRACDSGSVSAGMLSRVAARHPRSRSSVAGNRKPPMCGGPINTKGRFSRNSPSDAAPSQTPGHPAVGGFCPEKREANVSKN